MQLQRLRYFIIFCEESENDMFQEFENIWK